MPRHGRIEINRDGDVVLNEKLRDCSPPVYQEEPGTFKIPRSEYDPYLDPLFRTVLGWAQRHDDVLSGLVTAPVTPTAIIIFRRQVKRPSQVRYWPFKPHKDPAYQLMLGTSFRLASIRIKEDEQVGKTTRFPFQKEQDWLLLLDENITVTEVKNAVKNITRMLTGADRKIQVRRPVYENGSPAEDKIFQQQLKSESAPPVLRLVVAMGEKLKGVSSHKDEFPVIGDMEVNFQDCPTGFVGSWRELTALVRDVPLHFWHRGILTSMLSDDYWSFVVAKVAAQLSENKLKTLLHPAPVKQWWYAKMVAWATMDILALDSTEEWPSISARPNKRDMEAIRIKWIATAKSMSEKDRTRAAKIRLLLDIPTFSRNQTEQASLMLARLNYWVGKQIPKMIGFHHRKSHLGLDAAMHPFWAKKLRLDLLTVWPSERERMPTNKHGKILFLSTSGPVRFQVVDPQRYYEVNYQFTPEARVSPINQVLESILDSHQELGLVTTDRIVTWIKELNRRFEEMSIPAQAKIKWMATPKMGVEEATHEDRWLLKQSFSSITATNKLVEHPWFVMVEKRALPAPVSDLAWMIPDHFWTANNEEIDSSLSKSYKFKANRAAKCLALATYYTLYERDRLADPEVVEIMEFAALLSAEIALSPLKAMTYIEAINLSATAGDRYKSPAARWKSLVSVTAEHRVCCTNTQPPEGDIVVVWVHAVPGADGTKLVFELTDKDQHLLAEADPPGFSSPSEMTPLQLLGVVMDDLNVLRGAQWQVAFRKVRLSTLRLKRHVAFVATSTEAGAELTDRVTSQFESSPFDPEVNKDELESDTLAALKGLRISVIKEEKVEALMPVVITLTESSSELGIFYWTRTAFKDRTGPRTDALIISTRNIIAPGNIGQLRRLKDWGLAHLGNRAHTASERVRADRIETEFELTCSDLHY